MYITQIAYLSKVSQKILKVDEIREVVVAVKINESQGPNGTCPEDVNLLVSIAS